MVISNMHVSYMVRCWGECIGSDQIFICPMWCGVVGSVKGQIKYSYVLCGEV